MATKQGRSRLPHKSRMGVKKHLQSALRAARLAESLAHGVVFSDVHGLVSRIHHAIERVEEQERMANLGKSKKG